MAAAAAAFNAGLLPKAETGAEDFLATHPTHDGRGVVVAILDTGVDPGAAGLQVTSDGKPKIIDLIDCSGSGDVDTSTVVKALAGDDTEANGGGGGGVAVQGLSGRKLRLNSAWQNPTGKWHVGVKRASELYPRGLAPRVKSERKKEWTLAHRKVEADLQREVTQYKAAHTKPPATPDELADLADQEARVAQLGEMAKNYDDAGALYDVVVWHDGERWYAAVDVQEDGDLTGFKAMTDYHVARDWRTFNERLDNLNFSVGIFEEGNILSVVVDAGSHGTHVAGITAAYHPTNPAQNGLAPGAQIVSLKIGDTRLGSMETGVAFMRALREAVRMKVDMMNVSYGEATAVTGTGRVVKLIEEVVDKHGVIYVGSASNNGPALSTVGAPGGTGTATIAAGAYLSPSMMEAGYSLRKVFDGCNFTWSSVGPAYDGAQGPTIMAPGGAITSVPNWTMQKSMLMNGTSMAAPNACGSIALVLSALKAGAIKYTPQLIRKAITATAKPLPGLHPLVQGHGMVQVGPAYEYAAAHHAIPYVNTPMKVSVAGIKGSNCRGVYLREPGESKVSRDFKVLVEPQFHVDAASAEKVKYESRIALTLSAVSKDDSVGATSGDGGAVAPATWITIPSYFMLLNNGRGFNITVDGSRLPPGLHFAKVLGHDVEHQDLGPVFEVPITVVKPLEVAVHSKTKKTLGSYSFSSGQVQRNFLVPPAGSTWMDVTLTDLRHASSTSSSSSAGEEKAATTKDGSNIIVALQTVQLLPQTPFRDAEFEKYVSLAPGQKETFSVLVEAGVTVEVVLAQYAIAEGSITVGLEVEFRGLLPRTNTQDICLQGGHGYVHIPVDALVHDEELSPSAKLDKWQSKVVPSSFTLKPLDPTRDVLPDGKQIYQLVLEYKVTTTEASGEEVTPRALLLNGVLYESPLEAQFFLAYDSNKKLLGSGDVWPSSIKFPKGDNVLRYSIRHDDLSLLQGLQGLVVVLERALKNGKEVSVPDYATREEVMTKKKNGGGSRMLRRGCGASFFLGEPAFDKLPKGVKPGDVLLGSVTLEKTSGENNQVKSKRPQGFRLSYVVPPPPPEAPKPPSKPTAPDERSEAEKLAEKVRDVKVQHLGGLTEAVAFEALYAELVKEYPTHIPLLQARLKFVDGEKTRKEHLAEVVAAADAVVGLVDTQALALHFGVKVDENDPKAVKLRGEMEEKKTALADALARKARALIDLRSEAEGEDGSSVKTSPSSVVEVGEEAAEKDKKAKEEEEKDEVALVLAELLKWDNLEQDKYSRLVLERDARKGRWGLVLKLLNKLLGDAGNSSGMEKKELYARRLAVFEQLGWTHLLENERKWRVIDCPTGYALF